MHWTEPATTDDSPDCGDTSPLSRRDMSRAKSAVVPAQSETVNEAMRAIEKENPDLADVLPKSYHILERLTLASLLKTMASISMAKREVLNTEARELQARIVGNVTELLEA